MTARITSRRRLRCSQHRQDQGMGARLRAGTAASNQPLMGWTSSGDVPAGCLQFDLGEAMLCGAPRNSVSAVSAQAGSTPRHSADGYAFKRRDLDALKG